MIRMGVCYLHGNGDLAAVVAWAMCLLRDVLRFSSTPLHLRHVMGSTGADHMPQPESYKPGKCMSSWHAACRSRVFSSVKQTDLLASSSGPKPHVIPLATSPELTTVQN